VLSTKLALGEAKMHLIAFVLPRVIPLIVVSKPNLQKFDFTKDCTYNVYHDQRMIGYPDQISARRYEVSGKPDKGTEVPAFKPKSKSSAQLPQTPRLISGVSMETYQELVERTRFVTQTHIREE